tara:strand:- start:3400 stop:3747 length:348 start_codon:yes stop_codon:yes gene_type:complete
LTFGQLPGKIDTISSKQRRSRFDFYCKPFIPWIIPGRGTLKKINRAQQRDGGREVVRGVFQKSMIFFSNHIQKKFEFKNLCQATSSSLAARICRHPHDSRWDSGGDQEAAFILMG